MTDADQIARLRSALAEAQRPPRGRPTGPRTPEGKARAAGNATRHGLAGAYVRDPAERRALAARLDRLIDDLEPEGETEMALVERIAFALHRLERAGRLEAETFDKASARGETEGALLVASPRALHALDVVVRYGAAADAQLWRSLRALEARQARRLRTKTIDAPTAP